MRNLIKEHLDRKFSGLPATVLADITDSILELVCTPKFASQYPERISLFADLGLGDNVNLQWSKAMSSFTDAAKAAIDNLKTELGGATGPTADQIAAAVHTVVDPSIAAINDKLAAIQASEADDETKIGDLTNVITDFTAAFAPASTAPTTPLPGSSDSGSSSSGTGTATSGSGSSSSGSGEVAAKKSS